MNRQYTVADYLRAVDRLRAALDRPAISTDVIVGFPGETDRDFAATMDLVRQVGFSRVHAFPFSAVPPTAAWSWRDEAAPGEVVRRRMAALTDLQRRLAGRFARGFVGETLEGLVEAPRPRRRLREAMTDRYLRVFFRPPAGADGELTGQVIRLRITVASPAGLRGQLVTP